MASRRAPLCLMSPSDDVWTGAAIFSSANSTPGRGAVSTTVTVKTKHGGAGSGGSLRSGLRRGHGLPEREGWRGSQRRK